MSRIRNYYKRNPKYRPNEERLQRYERILELRSGSKKKPYREIGMEIGISGQRVHQIELVLLSKLANE